MNTETKKDEKKNDQMSESAKKLDSENDKKNKKEDAKKKKIKKEKKKKVCHQMFDLVQNLFSIASLCVLALFNKKIIFKN